MGCDIHGVIQIRISQKDFLNPCWKTMEVGYQARNYQVFTMLAEVRSPSEGIIPIDQCRGLPPDFIMQEEYHPFIGYTEEDEPRTLYWMGYHSYSYVSALELLLFEYEEKVLCMKTEVRNIFELFGAEFMAFIVKMQRYAYLYGHENVRFVFGFDS